MAHHLLESIYRSTVIVDRPYVQGQLANVHLAELSLYSALYI